jgi:hypothetical protein
MVNGRLRLFWDAGVGRSVNKGMENQKISNIPVWQYRDSTPSGKVHLGGLGPRARREMARDGCPYQALRFSWRSPSDRDHVTTTAAAIPNSPGNALHGERY